MISVIIPTYNRAHLIGETLDSIMAQTYPDWECIIIDDHSTDSTDDIINTYLFKDPRFIYYKKPKNLPKGPSASRNYGLTKASGDYINWFDSDDLMHPEKMQIDLKMITSGKYDFTISQSEFFKQDGAKPKKEYWNKNLWSNDPINDFIILKIGWSVNNPLWNKQKLLNKDINFHNNILTADDYDYHLFSIIKGMKPVVTNSVLVEIREHNERLNDYNLKAPSKIKVNNKILSFQNDIKLNQASIDFLNKQSYLQLNNLLKKKKFVLYLKYLFLLVKSNYNFDIKLKSMSKLPMGLFYLITNRGYKFLK
jgi:glycosyltransferase involved in cell wall biosynthesis